MGDDATARECTPAELDAMRRLLRESLEAGGIGLSSSRSFTHRDGDGKPVPSRWASKDELLALCAVAGEHPGTTLEFITDGCLNGFADDEIELMIRMSLAARRPLNWNVLTIDSRERARMERHLAASHEAEKRGARVVALSMPVLVGLTMSFLTYSPIHQLPGWREVLGKPLPERMAALRDPATRRWMEERAKSPEAGVFARVAEWHRYRIGETFSRANEGLSGRLVREIAKERGVSAFDALLDVVLADELQTILWPEPPDDDSASWELRRQAFDDPHVLLGGSDAGAHLDRMCGAPYTTGFLADCARGRRMWPLPRAIRALSDVPARLFGLRDRGRVAPGMWADLVLFDPASVGTGPIRRVADLPGGGIRLTADATGVERVMVAGRTIVAAGRPTGELPGRILRSGRDTETVAL
jgi:N-acyl-D-aspartate/D-glutamate deacylase